MIQEVNERLEIFKVDTFANSLFDNSENVSN